MERYIVTSADHENEHLVKSVVGLGTVSSGQRIVLDEWQHIEQCTLRAL